MSTTAWFSRRLGRIATAVGLAGLVATAGLFGAAPVAGAPLAGAASPTAPIASFHALDSEPLLRSAPPPGPNDIVWSVTPATAKGPDHRSHFSYNDIKTKGVLSDYIAISNFSTKPVTFHVYAEDGITTTDGTLGLQGVDKPVRDIGAWVRMLHDTVTVPARTELNEPFSVTVPANATPGDHVGGVIASITSTSAGSGAKVSQENRVAVALYLRVAGPLHPTLTVEGLTTTGYTGTLNPFGGGSTTVSYTVRNTGNVRLAGKQTVSVTGLFGIPLASVHPKTLEDMLPGGSVHITAHVSGIFPLALVTAHAQVAPFEVPDSPHLKTAPNTAEATEDIWAGPWPQLVLLAVLVGAFFLARFLLLRRKAQRSAALAAAVEQGRREVTEKLATVGASTVETQEPSHDPQSTDDRVAGGARQSAVDPE